MLHIKKKTNKIWQHARCEMFYLYTRTVHPWLLLCACLNEHVESSVAHHRQLAVVVVNGVHLQVHPHPILLVHHESQMYLPHV